MSRTASYQSRLKLIQQTETHQSHQLAALNRYLLTEFERYSLVTKVIFQFRYCDNEENRKRGRVGRVSGFRQATRDPRYVPANRQPSTRLPGNRVVRYYDFGRDGWRSVRRNENVSVIISAFWSEAEQRYVDTPEQAGLDASKVLQTPATDGSRQRRSQQRENQRRQRQIERQQNRRNR